MKKKLEAPMNIPKDPFILLSYVNTQLRDNFQSLEDMCNTLDISLDQVIETLKKIDYHYDIHGNQFK